MNAIIKRVAAFALGLATLGGATAFADDDDHRRGRDRDDDRYYDRRADEWRDDDRRGDEWREVRDGRPNRCDDDHDHRLHHRNYYDYYPRDRYFNADPQFSISLNIGDRGYYDRGGRYYDRPYYDRRGYRDHGRIVNRDRFGISGYRAEAIVIEEAFYGRRGSDLVCTVTARGPDARFVPYGQLRRIANRACSRRADIRIYA
jgi:hypothetical protein